MFKSKQISVTILTNYCHKLINLVKNKIKKKLQEHFNIVFDALTTASTDYANIYHLLQTNTILNLEYFLLSVDL